jgi:hypothetical protein
MWRGKSVEGRRWRGRGMFRGRDFRSNVVRGAVEREEQSRGQSGSEDRVYFKRKWDNLFTIHCIINKIGTC